MATSGKFRSTRRLRNWMVDQVNSGRYPGLMWDDLAKTMFRIPWKHAGKQDFRSNEDAAIFKAWAVFKGKLSEGARSDPASWKTRLRCALNKSPEFSEVNERSQLDISEPYKVYRLVPLDEQGLVPSGRKDGAMAGRKSRRRSNPDSNEENLTKKSKNEVVSSQPISMAIQQIEVEREITVKSDAVDESALIIKGEESVNEIQVNFMIETIPPAGALPYLVVSVLYMGQEVLRKDIFQKDCRIAYYPSSALQLPSSLSVSAVERVALPEPSSSLSPGSCTGQQLQAFSTLLSFMEKGVMLASTGSGIMAQRFCQGRVFWRGPHATEEGPHKLERTNNPIWLFKGQNFQHELDMFRSCGGVPPQCGITLCFGEELTDKEETTSKLITVQISLPWAIQQVQEAQSFRDSVTLLQTLASQSPLSEVTLNLVGIV